jgi:hypothetical protein
LGDLLTIHTTKGKIKMSINIEKVDNFPEISRSGRVSEELQMIIQALDMSVKTGDKFCIKGIEKGKAYNSMQQRIRAQAKKLGYNIVIRFDANDNTLFFKASAGIESETTVNAKEVTGMQTKAKTSK